MADGVVVLNCGSAGAGQIQTDTDNVVAVVAAATAANADTDAAALAAFMDARDPTTAMTPTDLAEANTVNDGSGD